MGCLTVHFRVINKKRFFRLDTGILYDCLEYLRFGLGHFHFKREVRFFKIIFLFENGKGVRVPASAYETKSNRRRLTGAFSSASPVIAAIWEKEETDILILATDGRGILIKSSLIPQKTTRTAAGVILFTLKKNQKAERAVYGNALGKFENLNKVRKTKIPASGSPVGIPDMDEIQLRIDG